MALASGVRGRMPAERNAMKDEKIARNLSPHESTRTGITFAKKRLFGHARSMSTEHQVLEREDQGLEPQN